MVDVSLEIVVGAITSCDLKFTVQEHVVSGTGSTVAYVYQLRGKEFKFKNCSKFPQKFILPSLCHFIISTPLLVQLSTSKILQDQGLCSFIFTGRTEGPYCGS